MILFKITYWINFYIIASFELLIELIFISRLGRQEPCPFDVCEDTLEQKRFEDSFSKFVFSYSYCGAFSWLSAQAGRYTCGEFFFLIP